MSEHVESEEQAAAPVATKTAKKKSAAGSLTFKVSAKGAASVYGLGRFPVTLYYEQWKRLLTSIPALETFLEDNKGQLKSKDSSDASPGEMSDAPESE